MVNHSIIKTVVNHCEGGINMYIPALKPEDIYENMYIIAVVLGLLEELAMEEEFSKRFHELTLQAWSTFPRRFVVEFPED